MKEYTLEEIFEKPINGEWGEELDENTRGVKVIRTTNFTNNGTLDVVNVVERDIDVEKYKNKILRVGDIIIEKSGGSPNQPVGRVVFFDKEDGCYFCNNFTSILRVKKGFNSKYLLYLLTNLYVQKRVMKYQNKTTGIINLKLNDYIKGTKVMIPSLEIQQQIVEVLDKSQAIVQKRREQIQACDELIKSQFIEMFGDPTNNPKGFELKRIDEVAELIKGITYSPEQVSDDGMIVLRSSNIKGSEFDLQDLVKVTKKIDESKWVKENDILMCNRNGSARLVGKVAKIPKLDETMTFGTFMTIVRSEYYEYLFTFFHTEAFRRQIQFQTAVAINQISLPLLASVTVPMPPVELQNEFAEFVQQVNKLKFEMEKSLQELEANFNSLMQRSFNGELF